MQGEGREGWREGGVGSYTNSRGFRLPLTPESPGPQASHFERNTFLEEISFGRGEVSLAGGKFMTTTLTPKGWRMARGPSPVCLQRRMRTGEGEHWRGRLAKNKDFSSGRVTH